MPILRTLLFFGGWFVWTGIMGVVALPGIFSARIVWWAAHLWAGGTLLWLRIACGIETHVEGREHLAGARIVASKHQSAWDTLILWYTLKNPVFVLKRELYWIPVFGWYLWRTGQIGIDRSNPKGAIERIARCMEPYAREGRVLVIFPEGTRVPPGVTKQFRPGVGRIAAALGWPVVPAALNAGLFWPKRPLVKRPGKATLRFLPPVVPPQADAVTPWVEQLQSTILSETGKLSGHR